MKGRHTDRVSARTVTVAGTAAVKPESVWEVLADPQSYARWVCGTVMIRRADGDWPRPGSRLYHCFGPWPFRVRDHTTVLAADRPRRLVLHAMARPLGWVRVDLDLTPVASGTRIRLRQEMRGGLGALFEHVGHVVQEGRNHRSLENLIDLVELDSGESDAKHGSGT